MAAIGRPRKTLESDSDRPVLLEMERAIRKGEHRSGGHAAAIAFADKVEGASPEAVTARLYKKYRKYKEALGALVEAESNSQPPPDPNLEHLLAEAVAGKSLTEKAEILERFIVVLSENEQLLADLRMRLMVKNVRVSEQNWRFLLRTILWIGNVELKQAGIGEKLNLFTQIDDQEEGDDDGPPA